MTITVLAMMTTLFAVAGASAGTTPYPAPPVTVSVSGTTTSSSTTTATTSTADVVTTSVAVRGTTGGNDPLASTGAGFDVASVVTVAGVLLLLGLALVIFGGRLLRRRTH